MSYPPIPDQHSTPSSRRAEHPAQRVVSQAISHYSDRSEYPDEEEIGNATHRSSADYYASVPTGNVGNRGSDLRTGQRYDTVDEEAITPRHGTPNRTYASGGIPDHPLSPPVPGYDDDENDGHYSYPQRRLNDHFASDSTTSFGVGGDATGMPRSQSTGPFQSTTDFSFDDSINGATTSPGRIGQGRHVMGASGGGVSGTDSPRRTYGGYAAESEKYDDDSLAGQSAFAGKSGGKRLSRGVRDGSALGGGIGAAGAPGVKGRSGGKGVGGIWRRMSSRARKWLVAIILLLIAIIGVAVAVPIATSSSHKTATSGSGSNTSGSSSIKPSTTVSAPAGVPTGASGSTDWKDAAFGGDGSTIYAEDGSSFIYNNTFGGFWNAIPFNDSAQAQASSPPLNEPWDYNAHLINGVNIGGWLCLEPFIVPAMFEPYNSPTDDPNATNLAIDEWTLSEQLTLANNLSAAMTDHYNTFITEKDFAEIAGAGLNWVRIPIGWWIIETWEGEPFLESVGWTYLLKAITWARKYGLRINLDLHAVPGSQNGYNHSGKQGSINFLNGVMGLANAQRTLNYIRTLTEFMSQAEYKNVMPMFSVLNEPYAVTIGDAALRNFYVEAYNVVRGITGLGEGSGPFITFHDGFITPSNVSAGGWWGFLNGWDRVALDTHNYLCFSQPNNDGLSYSAAKPCQYWADNFNTSAETFGLAMGGEWSLAVNDCGKWLNNVGNGQRYDGTYRQPGNNTVEYAAVGNCSTWNDWEDYDSATIAGLELVAKGHMDALRHWFFWTWKTGYSTVLGKIANPLWNYQLGLQQGWMPNDPRDGILGTCLSLVSENAVYGVTMSNNPAPTLSPWMTGGAGAGSITDQALYGTYSAWPPASLSVTPVSNLPTYTPTAAIITQPVATPTSYPSGYSSSVSPGDGWENPSDTAGWYTAVAGCTYPDPWSGAGLPIPTTAFCNGAEKRMMMKRQQVVIDQKGSVVPPPGPTPPPTTSYRL